MRSLATVCNQFVLPRHERQWASTSQPSLSKSQLTPMCWRKCLLDVTSDYCKQCIMFKAQKIFYRGLKGRLILSNRPKYKILHTSRDDCSGCQSHGRAEYGKDSEAMLNLKEENKSLKEKNHVRALGTFESRCIMKLAKDLTQRLLDEEKSLLLCIDRKFDGLSVDSRTVFPRQTAEILLYS